VAVERDVNDWTNPAPVAPRADEGRGPRLPAEYIEQQTQLNAEQQEREYDELLTLVMRFALGDDANVFEVMGLEQQLRNPDAARRLARELGLDEREELVFVKGAKQAHRADQAKAEQRRFWTGGV
jgi:hypothetical protein